MSEIRFKKMYIGRHVQYLFLSNFNKTWIFLGRLSKNTQVSNLMKIRPRTAKLLHADRRADGQTNKHALWS